MILSGHWPTASSQDFTSQKFVALKEEGETFEERITEIKISYMQCCSISP